MREMSVLEEQLIYWIAMWLIFSIHVCFGWSRYLRGLAEINDKALIGWKEASARNLDIVAQYRDLAERFNKLDEKHTHVRALWIRATAFTKINDIQSQADEIIDYMSTLEKRAERSQMLRALASRSLDALREGKAKFAPLTTNSHVDVLIADLEKMENDGGGDDMSRSDLQNIQTIAAQAKVIEKLKEQRDNLAHDAAYEINYGPHPKEALEKIKELDAELIAALTKQPEPKEGV